MKGDEDTPSRLPKTSRKLLGRKEEKGRQKRGRRGEKKRGRFRFVGTKSYRRGLYM